MLLHLPLVINSSSSFSRLFQDIATETRQKYAGSHAEGREAHTRVVDDFVFSPDAPPTPKERIHGVAAKSYGCFHLYCSQQQPTYRSEHPSPPQQNAHAPWAPPSPRGRHRLLVCCCPSASTHRCRKRTRQHQKARHHSCGSLKFFTLTGLHPERYRTADNDSARCSIDSMQAALHATHANTQRPRSRLSD